MNEAVAAPTVVAVAAAAPLPAVPRTVAVAHEPTPPPPAVSGNLERFGLREPTPDPAFDRLVRLARRMTAAPLILAAFQENDTVLLRSVDFAPECACGTCGQFWAAGCERPSSDLPFAAVDETDQTRVVSDSHTDAASSDGGIVAYLSVPLHSPTGQVLGVLCAVDFVPRAWTAADREALEEMAALAETEIALRRALADVEERRAARVCLTRVCDALRRENETLREFASVASHDLQEPLRKVQAFGGRLRQRFDTTLDDEGRDYLARMMGAAERMQTLIHDLLLYSRVTTQAHPFASVSVGEVVAGVLRDQASALQNAGALVELRGPLPVIEADAIQVRQVFQNLLSNALKFRTTDAALRIEIFAEREQETRSGTESAFLDDGGESVPFWRITISDNGIGFEPNQAERIFGVFERLHLRGEYDGNGMGLAICRRIAERHGGSITASAAPGGGAVFTLHLPERQPHGA